MAAKKKQTKKTAKKKNAEKNRRPAAGREFKVLLAALFVVVFLLGSMALVQLVRDSLRPESAQRKVRPAISQPRAPTPESGPSALTQEQVLPPVAPAPAPAVPEDALLGENGPRAAIIMDDLGQDLHAARRLAAIDLAVTFAVMPETPYAEQTAELAHAAGREILIHLPMEPLSYPAIDPGPNALLVALDSAELRRRLRSYIPKVPHAVGGNNHMGSRFTMDARKMAPVLDELRAHGLFFVDSVTSGSSVAFTEARRLGMPAGRRDLFLDNDQDVAAIRQELRRLATLARRHGQAVGICHPYPETLAALQLEQGIFEREGVAVVPVSRLLTRP